MILITRTKLPNEHSVCSATEIHKKTSETKTFL